MKHTCAHCGRERTFSGMFVAFFFMGWRPGIRSFCDKDCRDNFSIIYDAYSAKTERGLTEAPWDGGRAEA